MKSVARWAGHRHRKSAHGYKAHVATNQEARLIRAVEITTANVHEAAEPSAILPDAPGDTYGDSAYAGPRPEGINRARGGTPRIVHTSTRGGPEALARLEAHNAEVRSVHARATGGDIAMAGVDLDGGAPPEAKAAMAAELRPVFKTDRREYLKSNYSAVSLAEAVRQILPKAEVSAVAGTGVVPSEATDLPAAVAAARNVDVVILAVGGRSAWSDERTEEFKVANDEFAPPGEGLTEAGRPRSGSRERRQYLGSSAAGDQIVAEIQRLVPAPESATGGKPKFRPSPAHVRFAPMAVIHGARRRSRKPTFVQVVVLRRLLLDKRRPNQRT